MSSCSSCRSSRRCSTRPAILLSSRRQYSADSDDSASVISACSNHPNGAARNPSMTRSLSSSDNHDTPRRLLCMDLENKIVWIPDSKTPNGVGEFPLTDLAVEAIRDQIQLAGSSPYLFPRENAVGHQTTFKTAWRLTLRRAKVPYFRIYDLRSTYATRLSAGGVADEWVTQLLRQGDAQVFKKYSQMKREALRKLNRAANEDGVLRQAI